MMGLGEGCRDVGGASIKAIERESGLVGNNGS